VQDYLESHLRPHVPSTVSDSDMLKMLSESGGSVVNAVLYLISSSGITREDITYLNSIQQMTGVIPVISGADALSVEEVATMKDSVEHELATAGIKPLTLSTMGISDTCLPVYAISSAPSSEYDLTDQSLLVSSEYMQPLATTDLGKLVDDILCPDGASWLRHTAANKFLQWRRNRLQKAPIESPQMPDLSLVTRPFLHQNTMVDQDRRQLYWSNRVGIGEDAVNDWSTSLRRSLSNDGWVGMVRSSPLQEKTLELRPAPGTCHPLWAVSGNTSRASSRGALTRPNGMDKLARRRVRKCPTRQDPLGLLHIFGSIRCDGQVTLELLGTVGILGTVGLWIWRSI